MDNILHIEELTTERIAELLAHPEELHDQVFSNCDDWKVAGRTAMANGNIWQTIHLLLADDPWDGPWPLNFMAALNVGTTVSYHEEHPPAKFFNPEEAQAISNALQEITPQQLAERFDPNDRRLFEVDCPMAACDTAEEFVTEYLVPNYEEIRDFIAAAAGRNKGLLVAWAIL